MKLLKKLAAGILAAAMAVSAAPAGVSAEGAASRAYEIDYTKDDLYTLEGGSTVYVNGKDQKQNGEFYKTCSFQFAGRTLGAKKNVAVIPEETFDNYNGDYDQIFTSGKLRSDVAKAGKQYASARIDQNGKVTVTAGKKTGHVYILVYEAIDKKLIHKKDGGLGEKFGVGPLMTNVGVYAAHSAILYTTDETKLIWTTEIVSVVDGNAIAEQYPILKKSDASVSLSVGETATLYLADKKAIPSSFEDIGDSRDSPLTIEDGTFDSTIVTICDNPHNGVFYTNFEEMGCTDKVLLPDNTVRYFKAFTLKGLRAGKTTLIITDPVSGKTAKVKVVVK